MVAKNLPRHLGSYTFARNGRACRFYERHAFVAVARGFEPNWRLEDVRYEWIRDKSVIEQEGV